MQVVFLDKIEERVFESHVVLELVVDLAADAHVAKSFNFEYGDLIYNTKYRYNDCLIIGCYRTQILCSRCSK